jgi:two-component system LytT family response regulator
LEAGHAVQLILLDIRMPGEGGLSLARYISDLTNPPLLAFVTAYDEYAIDAFELFAIDYLQKPFSDERLAKLLARAKAMYELRVRADGDLLRALVGDLSARETGAPPPLLNGFTVRSIGSVERIALRDVLSIRGAGNYVELQLKDRMVLHRASLGAIARRLPQDQFLQVHRTAIVRRDELAALKTDGGERYRIELRSGDSLPVSAKHLPSVRAEILAEKLDAQQIYDSR